MSVAIVFAVADEAGAFLKRVRWMRAGHVGGAVARFGRIGDVELVAMAAGMGASAAGPVRALFDGGERIDRLWLAGYGGGLDPGLRRGDVVVMRPDGCGQPAVIRLRRGRRVVEGRIAHVEALASTAAMKGRLFAEGGGVCCDMESGVVGAIAEARGIPWGAVRAISDTADQDLPARLLGAAWDSVRRRPAPGRLIRAMFRHPREVPGFIRFVAGLGLARENLARVLAAVVGA